MAIPRGPDTVKHLSALPSAFKPSHPVRKVIILIGMKAIYLFQALICGAIISFIDSRSDAVQAAALLILATTFIFGLLHARRAWAYALIIGLSIVAMETLTTLTGWPAHIGPQPTFAYSGLIALLPAFIGAYSGAGLRWVLDGLNESQHGQTKAS